MILLDTIVISELIKPIPDPAVVAFLGRAVPETVFTAEFAMQRSATASRGCPPAADETI